MYECGWRCGCSDVMIPYLQRTLSLVSSVRELPCWSACLPSQSSHILVNHKTPSSHLLQFTCRDTSKGSLQKWRKILHSRISSWMVKYLPFLERLVPTPQGIITEVLERYVFLCYYSCLTLRTHELGIGSMGEMKRVPSLT